MIPTSNREPDRFVPVEFSEPVRAALEQELAATKAKKKRAKIEKALEAFDDPPTYLIEIPGVFSKAQFHRACIAIGAQYDKDQKLFEVLRRGIVEVVEDHGHAECLELVDQFEATAAADRDDELEADMERLEFRISENYQHLAEIHARRTYYMEVAPIIAAQMFLLGWKNVEVDFKRRNGKVPIDRIESLPAGHAYQVGIRAMGLMHVTADQAKNSK